ncbi:MAG: hypothetical protein V1925_05550 [Candidatus Omnitrophota bacterium]
MLSRRLMRQILLFQEAEITEHIVYKRLSQFGDSGIVVCAGLLYKGIINRQ